MYVCVYSYICVPQELHFVSGTEQIYHLIKGKRAGVLAVPELSLLVPGVLWWKGIWDMACYRGPSGGWTWLRFGTSVDAVAQRASCS